MSSHEIIIILCLTIQAVNQLNNTCLNSSLNYRNEMIDIINDYINILNDNTNHFFTLEKHKYNYELIKE